MRLVDLVSELLKVSEKAADLARTVRSEQTLFELLVEEKKGEEQNKRFVQDFKTLADVLVQETVRSDMGSKFNGLRERIDGEESNHFMNTLGESVTICIQENENKTAELLGKVLDGNTKAASLLAAVVHREMPNVTNQELENIPDIDIAEDTVGIWIDPIDSTAQYIQGEMEGLSQAGIHSEGLRCVVVIIGVYRLDTGLPIVGVVNQPFISLDESCSRWTGRSVWSVSMDSHLCHGPLHLPADEHPELPITSSSLVLSSSEDESIQQRLREHYQLIYAAGAGYKILNVLDGLVCGYVLSKGSTFKWDTCAPHAILLSLGGGVVDYGQIFERVKELESDWGKEDLARLAKGCQIVYNRENEIEGVERWSNSRGLIAYRCIQDLCDIVKCLC